MGWMMVGEAKKALQKDLEKEKSSPGPCKRRIVGRLISITGGGR